jgi:hypothetical protein
MFVQIVPDCLELRFRHRSIISYVERFVFRFQIYLMILFSVFSQFVRKNANKDLYFLVIFLENSIFQLINDVFRFCFEKLCMIVRWDSICCDRTQASKSFFEVLSEMKQKDFVFFLLSQSKESCLADCFYVDWFLDFRFRVLFFLYAVFFYAFRRESHFSFSSINDEIMRLQSIIF